ncbi:MAG TPA: hypothetical protein PLV05_06940, partial [Verrucomicrobiota bacterium]|nr:hypothetical protein [Verrucomicrobiota bacterium]HOQ55291.1 hypothetical protein [Verrucomicrobiota bacterium]HPC52825.1 hypothetical protein [Verrucomicrobiota bacterium]HPL35454.1 hypothetical protein [Verrucomicrobiota bacterium]HRV39719.1 hypothetical protein [Candidatus Paceibacterota bacterium]
MLNLSLITPFSLVVSAFPGTQPHYPDTVDIPCLQAVYKGCTRDAHRVYQLKSYELPVRVVSVKFSKLVIMVSTQG